jgi:6-phosphofructokinase 1
MVTIQQGKFKPIRFEEMLDPETGRTRVRMVDVDTEYYKIARRYMLRLRRDDFRDPGEFAKYAAVIGSSPERFKELFEYLVADEAPPLAFDHS